MKCDKYINSYLSSFSRLSGGGDGIGSEMAISTLPTMEEISRLEKSLLALLYPGRGAAGHIDDLDGAVRFEMEFFISLLTDCVRNAYKYEKRAERPSGEELTSWTAGAVDSLMSSLGDIRRLLKKDAQAGFDGDPAATSVSEVIVCYPAFRALAVHRVAHHLFRLGVPLVPRMMNELVHGETGIDIHPGAEIGESFFIDHGTGVVIGETCVIGNNVKLYQGVTLGALSFPKNACGELLKEAKRHPTIEDDVTIYANATVLGDITIGKGSTIGSSCWIKTDIPPYTRATMRDPETVLKPRRS